LSTFYFSYQSANALNGYSKLDETHALGASMKNENEKTKYYATSNFYTHEVFTSTYFSIGINYK